MSSRKQSDVDNQTVTTSTEKNDDQDSNSKTTETDDDTDTDSNASSEYEVERILAKRRNRHGLHEYYIKWVGYDDSANEWIPETSLNCPERLAEFEREEQNKRKRVQKVRDRNDSRKRRKNDYRTRKRRSHENRSKKRQNSEIQSKKRQVRVVDDEEETTMTTVKSVESTNSLLATTNKDKDQPTNEITYGIQKGYKVQAILGINRTKSDQLHYLVHYIPPTSLEDNMELIPSDIAKRFCEEEIIQFYEARIIWNDPLAE